MIPYMAEPMEVPPKQVSGFFNPLIETGDGSDQEARRDHDPGLGQASGGATRNRDQARPATGEAIQIEANTAVKFRLAKAARDAAVPPKT